jgi:hypothetical protein
MMLIHDELEFDNTGRRSVELRMELIYGKNITVLKAKSAIRISIDGLIGRVLTPDQLRTAFGGMIYPDWGGEPNTISEVAQLYKVETNQATSYLIFQQLS